MAKLTIEIEPDVFEKAVDTVYKKQRSRINVPGFRKGKAPRQIIERMYGSEVFYEDAADEAISTEYPKAYDMCEEEIVSQPEIEIKQLRKGEPFIFTAKVALRPDVKLGKYKGVTVAKNSTTVTKKDVEEEVERILKQNSRQVEITDRNAEKDDIVNIDYLGKTDDVPFEGGKGEGYDLTLGSGSFIPGFEEQLIGHGIGEEFDIDVTFPEKYHSEELAGKKAVFTVKINGIKAKEIPELNDEYVSDTTEFETVDEYKDDIKSKLKQRKENAARLAIQEEAIEKIVADSEMELPEPMIDTQVRTMMNEYARGMMGQGLSMEQYFQMTGLNPEQLMEQMRPEAEKQIKTSLVLEEIAKVENIEVTEEDIDKHLDEMGAMYMIEGKELKKNLTEDDEKKVRTEVAVMKAAEFVADNAKQEAKKTEKKQTEKKSTKKDKEEE